MSKNPTLMFCVGATKAGTSWLHRFLSDHDACHMRSVKELHYFDGLDMGNMDEHAERNLRTQNRLISRLLDADDERAQVLSRQINDRGDWDEVISKGTQDVDGYLNYLNDGLNGQQVVGDITPSYSLLSQERLSMMARICSDVRFIYVLRDPIDRFWSHVRMIATRRSDDGQVSRGRVDNIFRRSLRGEEGEIVTRSDYRGAIEKLLKAVDPSKLLIVFYEDLFHGDAVARICDFLGIARKAGDRQTLVHAGQPLAMHDSQRVKARDWLADQYDYVRAMGNMPKTWQYELGQV